MVRYYSPELGLPDGRTDPYPLGGNSRGPLENGKSAPLWSQRFAIVTGNGTRIRIQ